MELRCARGGALVGMDEWLPTDAFDRDWGDLHPAVGCNHLQCAACGAPVRRWDAVRPASEALVMAAPIYAGDRTSLTAEPWSRTYGCRCNLTSTASYTVLAAAAAEDFGFQSRWACAGHPRLLPPCQLDGVAIDAEPAAAAIVDAVFRGDQPANVPWSTPATDRPGYWLIRAVGLLAPDPAAAALSREVALRLRSTDARTLRCAWEFFAHHPGAPGAEHVAPAFRAERARLRKTVDVFEPKRTIGSRCVDTLERRLSIRDAGGIPRDKEAIVALYEAVFDGTSAHHGLFTLGQFDADGLAARIDEYLTLYPANISTFLVATGARTDGRPVVAGLIRFGRCGAEAARAVVAELGRLPAEDREAVAAALETPQ